MSAHPGTGQLLGHYRLVEQLGGGGMGLVYRAHDERLDRDVALKVLSDSRPIDEDARKHFRQEAHALARLNHPNIATIYDFDSDGSIDFLVMELLNGQTVAERLYSGPLSQDFVIGYALQMCEGLAAAHAQGILHRDLKPANLGLTSDGRVKILDFGLATLARGQPDDLTRSITMAGVVKGTLGYMAPEQLRGQNADARADIYSAGAVLYEMATGKRPHDEQGGALLINAVLNQQPARPSTLVPAIDAGMEAIILKALEKDPEKRYQSAEGLASDLKLLNTASKPAALRQRSSSRRRRMLQLIMAAVIVTLAALLSWRAVHRRAGTVAGPRPVLLVGDFENRTGNSVFDNSLHEMFTSALEQSHMVQIFPPSRVASAMLLMGRSTSKGIDESTGLEICQRENLQGLLLGSIVRLGSKYVLLVRVEGPSGAHLATVEKSAKSEDEIPGLIDEIAETLRHRLGEPLESVQETSVPLARVSSPSLEAVRYFTLGKENQYRGKYGEAEVLFRKAIELDPNFAVAHEYLGYVYQHVFDFDRGNDQIRQAAKLAERLSEPERLRIMADYYSTLLDFDHECENYQILTQLQPQDPSPHINLGYCERERLNYKTALQETEKALELVPHSAVRNNLVTDLILTGESERALQVALSSTSDFPEDLGGKTQLGRAFMATGRMEEAAKVFGAMLQGDRDWQIQGGLCLADLQMAEGKYGEAEGTLKAAMLAADRNKNRVAAIKARSAMAEIMLSRNMPPSSIRQTLAQANLPPNAPSLEFVLARSYARSGSMAQANKASQDIDRLIAAHDVPALQALRFLIKAEVALVHRNSAGAISAAQKAVEYQHSVFAMETLARAYAAAGEYAQAAQEYEIVAAGAPEFMDDVRSESFDAPAFRRAVDAHYRLGILYQKLGRFDAARRHLEKFMVYWSHADGGLPIYQDAQRVLRSLPSTGVPTPAT